MERDVKQPPVDDGLSLRSESITGASDEGEDALGIRQKIIDEEQQVQPPMTIQQMPYQLSRLPITSPSGPARLARGGQTEHNVEWRNDL